MLVACFGIPAVLVFGDRNDSTIESLVEVAAITLVCVATAWYQGLWSTRITSVRMIELSRIPRVFVVGAIAAAALTRRPLADLWGLAVLGLLSTLAFLVWRSAYRAFIAAERRSGTDQHRVFIVGSTPRAFALLDLFDTHPELGMTVAGIASERTAAAAAGCERLWIGSPERAGELVTTVDPDLVIACAAGLDEDVLRDLTYHEWCRGRALSVDPGLPSLDFRRVHTTAIAHQPLLTVEPPPAPLLAMWIKRCFDIVVAGMLLILASPLFALITVAIKVEDGGPVLFKQRRVGRHGSPFKMIKFRTMVVHAEAQLDQLNESNERRGPLFKMDDSADPRITRVGRFLRSTSFDELPQLLNVLRGEMSLVGPRPALDHEVAQFPPELLQRHDVRPGITGLWQVEARDNASFEAYRRLDLFYVTNWSMMLDLMILVATIDQVLFRPILGRGHRPVTPLELQPPFVDHSEPISEAPWVA